MTLANRRDYLDALLVNVAERKQRRMVPLLKGRLARTTKLHSKYASELDTHTARATADGVTDLDGAVAAFKREHTQPSRVALNARTPRSDLEVRTSSGVHVAFTLVIGRVIRHIASCSIGNAMILLAMLAALIALLLQKAYVRLLWAREGRAQLDRVRKQLAGVSVDAVTRLTKAAQASNVDSDISRLEVLLGIGFLNAGWKPGEPDYNRVINEIVQQELERWVSLWGRSGS
jgi:hypothetical protein